MVTNQAYLFLIFSLNGFAIGLLFDFFRILRKSFKTSDIITYIEDIVFWTLSGIIVLYSIFIFNNGEIRIYMFLAILLGIIIYMLLLSSYIIKINVFIINKIKKAIKLIINTIKIPLNLILRVIKRILFKPVSFIFINFSKSMKNIKINLKDITKKCKNNINNTNFSKNK